MRIGMICYPSYGGSGVVATELGIHLAKRGHEIHFISYERPFKLNNFYENVFFHEVEIFDYPVFKFPPYSLALASKILEVVRTAHLDVLHAHYAIPHSVSAYLANQMLKDKKLPLITTLHGTDITLVGNNKQFYDLTKLSIENSDGVTTVSQNLKDETIEIFNIDTEIEVIYNFICPAEYKPTVFPHLRERYAKENEKIIMHISNFRPVKRIDLVVDIFAKINQEVPSHLLFVGDGPELMTIEKQAQDLGLADRVHFLGKQERVIELLSIADLFLLPSEKESFGLVALEAMACCVPVIASATGGLPELVKDGICGYLSPVGDVNKMAQDSIKLLKDPVLHKQTAAAARQRAVDLFHCNQIVSQYEDYYNKFL